jgi:uncharacterized circularly permuted ATP-grasp superfamily protein
VIRSSAVSGPSGRTEIDRREELQTLSLIRQGVTFTVDGEGEPERIFRFDFVPRDTHPTEGTRILSGLAQRLAVLDCAEAGQAAGGALAAPGTACWPAHP